MSRVSSAHLDANCKVFNKKSNSYVLSPSCYKRDRDIFIKLTSNEYTVGTSLNFEINGVVKSPEIGG